MTPLALARVPLITPVSPGVRPGPAGGAPVSPRVRLAWRLPVARARPVRLGRSVGRVLPTAAAAAPFVFREPPERVGLSLKVREGEVGEGDRVLLVHVWGERDGGGAPRAPPRARQRRLVDEVDHLVAAKTPRGVLAVLPAAGHARQVLEGVRTFLRAPPLAVRVVVVVVLLVVGDQTVPAPLAARQGGAVVGRHYHVLAGAPSVKV